MGWDGLDGNQNTLKDIQKKVEDTSFGLTGEQNGGLQIPLNSFIVPNDLYMKSGGKNTDMFLI